METEAEIPEPISIKKREGEDKDLTSRQLDSLTEGDLKKVEEGHNQPPETVEYSANPDTMQAAIHIGVETVSTVIKGNVGTLEGESFLESPSVANIASEETCRVSEHHHADEIPNQAEKEMSENETQLQKDQTFESVEEMGSRKNEVVEETKERAEKGIDSIDIVSVVETGLPKTKNEEPALKVEGEETLKKQSTEEAVSSSQKDENTDSESSKQFLDIIEATSDHTPDLTVDSSNKDVETVTEACNREEIINNITETTLIQEELEETNCKGGEDKESEKTSNMVAMEKGPEANRTVTENPDIQNDEEAILESGEGAKDKLDSPPLTLLKDKTPVEDEIQDTNNLDTPFVIQTEEMCLQKVEEPEIFKEVSEIWSEDVVKESPKEVEDQIEILEKTAQADSTTSEKGKDDENPEQKLDGSFIKHEESMQSKGEGLAMTEASAGENRNEEKFTVVVAKENISNTEIVEDEEHRKEETSKHEEDPEQIILQHDEPKKEKHERSLNVISEMMETAASSENAETITCVKEERSIKNLEESFEEEGKEDKPTDTDDNSEYGIPKEKYFPPVDLNEKIESVEVEIPEKNVNDLHVTHLLVEKTEQVECEKLDEVSKFEPLEEVNEANGASTEEEKQIEEESEACKSTETTTLEHISTGAATKELISSKIDAEKLQKIYGLDSEEKLEVKDAGENIEEETQKNEESFDTEMHKFTTRGDDTEKGIIEEDAPVKVCSTVGVADETIEQSIQVECLEEEAPELSGDNKSYKAEDDVERNNITDEEVHDGPKITGTGEVVNKNIIEGNVRYISPELIEEETVKSFQENEKEAERSKREDTKEQIIEECNVIDLSPEFVAEGPIKNFQDDEKEVEKFKVEILDESETAEAGERIARETKQVDESPEGILYASSVTQERLQGEAENLSPTEASDEEKREECGSTVIVTGDEDNITGLVKAKENSEKVTSKDDEDAKQILQQVEPSDKIERSLNVMSGEIEEGVSSENAENITCMTEEATLQNLEETSEKEMKEEAKDTDDTEQNGIAKEEDLELIAEASKPSKMTESAVLEMNSKESDIEVEKLQKGCELDSKEELEGKDTSENIEEETKNEEISDLCLHKVETKCAGDETVEQSFQVESLEEAAPELSGDNKSYKAEDDVERNKITDEEVHDGHKIAGTGEVTKKHIIEGNVGHISPESIEEETVKSFQDNEKEAESSKGEDTKEKTTEEGNVINLSPESVAEGPVQNFQGEEKQAKNFRGEIFDESETATAGESISREINQDDESPGRIFYTSSDKQEERMQGEGENLSPTEALEEEKRDEDGSSVIVTGDEDSITGLVKAKENSEKETSKDDEDAKQILQQDEPREKMERSLNVMSGDIEEGVSSENAEKITCMTEEATVQNLEETSEKEMKEEAKDTDDTKENGIAKEEGLERVAESSETGKSTESTVLELNSKESDIEVEKLQKGCELDSKEELEGKDIIENIEEEIKNEETSDLCLHKVETKCAGNEMVEQSFQVESLEEAAPEQSGDNKSYEAEDDVERNNITDEEVHDGPKIAGTGEVTKEHVIEGNVRHISPESIEEETVKSFQDNEKEAESSKGEDTKEQTIEEGNVINLSPESVAEGPVQNFQGEEKEAEKFKGEIFDESETATAGESISHEINQDDESPGRIFYASSDKQEERMQGEGENLSPTEAFEEEKRDEDGSSVIVTGDEDSITGLVKAKENSEKETSKDDEHAKQILQQDEPSEKIERSLNVMSGNIEEGVSSENAEKITCMTEEATVQNLEETSEKEMKEEAKDTDDTEENGIAKEEGLKRVAESSETGKSTESTVLELNSKESDIEVEKFQKGCELDSKEELEGKDTSGNIVEEIKNEETSDLFLHKVETKCAGDETVEQSFQAESLEESAPEQSGDNKSYEAEDDVERNNITDEEVHDGPKIAGTGEVTKEHIIEGNVGHISPESIEEETVKSFQDNEKEAESSKREDTKEQTTEEGNVINLSPESVAEGPVQNFQGEEKEAEKFKGEIFDESETATAGECISREINQDDESPGRIFYASSDKQKERMQGEGENLSPTEALEEEKRDEDGSSVIVTGDEDSITELVKAKENSEKETSKDDEDAKQILQQDEPREKIERSLNVMSGDIEEGVSSENAEKITCMTEEASVQNLEETSEKEMKEEAKDTDDTEENGIAKEEGLERVAESSETGKSTESTVLELNSKESDIEVEKLQKGCELDSKEELEGKDISENIEEEMKNEETSDLCLHKVETKCAGDETVEQSFQVESLEEAAPEQSGDNKSYEAEDDVERNNITDEEVHDGPKIAGTGEVTKEHIIEGNVGHISPESIEEETVKSFQDNEKEAESSKREDTKEQTIEEGNVINLSPESVAEGPVQNFQGEEKEAEKFKGEIFDESETATAGENISREINQDDESPERIFYASSDKQEERLQGEGENLSPTEASEEEKRDEDRSSVIVTGDEDNITGLVKAKENSEKETSKDDEDAKQILQQVEPGEKLERSLSVMSGEIDEGVSSENAEKITCMTEEAAVQNLEETSEKEMKEEVKDTDDTEEKGIAKEEGLERVAEAFEASKMTESAVLEFNSKESDIEVEKRQKGFELDSKEELEGKDTSENIEEEIKNEETSDLCLHKVETKCAGDETVEQSFQVESLEDASPELGGDNKSYKAEDDVERNNITDEEVHDGPKITGTGEVTKEHIIEGNVRHILPESIEETTVKSFQDNEKEAESPKGEDTKEQTIEEGNVINLSPESVAEGPVQNFQGEEKDAEKFKGEIFEESETAEAGESISREINQDDESPERIFYASSEKQEERLQGEGEDLSPTEASEEEKREVDRSSVVVTGDEENLTRLVKATESEKETSKDDKDAKQSLQQDEQGEKLELEETLEKEMNEEAKDTDDTKENGIAKEDLELVAEASKSSKSTESTVLELKTKDSEIEVEKPNKGCELDSKEELESKDAQENIEEEIKNEEVYEGRKIAGMGEDTEKHIIQEEHTVMHISPESIGEETSKNSEEDEKEEENPKVEMCEELETTSVGEGIEKENLEEENTIKNQSTVSVGVEINEESSKEDDMLVKMPKQEVCEIIQIADGGEDTEKQITEEVSAVKDDYEVFEITGTGQDSREQIVKEIDSVKDHSPESIEKETLGESSKEDEVCEGFKTAGSSTNTEKQNIDEHATPDLSSLSVGEETVKESSKEDESDAIKLKEEVKDKYLEFTEQIEATDSMEEKKLETLKDRAETHTDLDTLNSKETSEEESNESLVEHSLVSEVSEKEIKTEILDKEEPTINDSDSASVTVVTEEKCLKEAEPEDKKQNLESADPGEKLECASELVAEDQSNKPLPETSQTQIEENNDDVRDQNTESEQQISGQRFLEGKKDMGEEAEPKAEDHIKETQNANESIKDVILTENVPEGSEQAGENEKIKEQIIQEENDTKELHTVSAGDDTVNEQKKDSNEQIETINLEVEEDLDREQEASPLTKASEEATMTEGGNEKPLDVSISESEVSEEKIKEEIVEQGDNSYNNLDTASVTGVTKEKSLGEHQPDDKCEKAFNNSSQEASKDDEILELGGSNTNADRLPTTHSLGEEILSEVGEKCEEASNLRGEGEDLSPTEASEEEKRDEDRSSVMVAGDEENITRLVKAKENSEKETSKDDEDAKQILQQDEPSEKLERSLNVMSGEIEEGVSSENAEKITCMTEEAAVQNLEETSEKEMKEEEEAKDTDDTEENEIAKEEDLELVAEASEASKSTESTVLELNSKESDIEVFQLQKGCELDSKEVLEGKDTSENIEEEIKNEETSDFCVHKVETKCASAEKSVVEDDVTVKDSNTVCIGEEAVELSCQEDENREKSTEEVEPKSNSGDQSCKTYNETENLKNQFINEEAYEGPKIAGMGEDTEKYIIQDEHTVTDISPESIGEETSKSSEEDEKEEKKPKVELCEELETTSVSEGIEKQNLEEESTIKNRSTVSIRVETNEESSKEDDMVAKTPKQEECEIIQTADGSKDTVKQITEEDSAVKDDFKVFETTGAGQDTREQIIKEIDSVKDHTPESIENKTLGESFKEDKVCEGFETTASSTNTEKQNIEERATPDLSSLSVGEETVKEISKEDGSDAIKLKEEVKDSFLEFTEQIEATGSTEETKSETLKDREETHTALDALNTTETSEEETPPEESNESLVKHSLVSEVSEKEIKTEILDKEEPTINDSDSASVTGVTEEKCLKGAEPEDKKQNLESADPGEKLECASESVAEDQSNKPLPETSQTQIEENNNDVQDQNTESEQQISGQRFRESKKEMDEEAELKLEAEDHIKETQNANETIEDVILTEKVPEGSEKADENENINNQIIKEESDTKELHTVSTRDETDNEEKNSDLVSIENLKPTDSNEQIETINLEVEEDLDREQEVSPLAQALEKETMEKVGNEKPVDVSISESKVSEEEIKEEIVEQADKCYDKLDTASVTVVTKEKSLGEPQLDDTCGKTFNNSLQEASKDEEILDLGGSNKNANRLPTTHSLGEDILPEVGETCEEASNLKLDKTEQALESASEVHNHEVLTESEETEIKEEHLEAAMSESRAEENQFEANEIIKNEELSEKIEKTGASRTIITQITQEDRALGDSNLVSVEDETIKESLPDEAAGKNVEEAAIKLNLENQGDTTNFRDGKTEATTLSEEEPIEISRGNEKKPDEAKIHGTISANEDREIQYQTEKPDDLAYIQDFSQVISQKEGSVVLAEAQETTQDIQKLEKASHSISEKQILREADPSEITETIVSTGNKDGLLVVQDPIAKTLQKGEVKDLEPGKASEIESELNEETTKESTSRDSAKISLSNLLERSTEETYMTEEKEPTANKEEIHTEKVETLQVEEAKTDEERDEEEEGDEHKKEDSGSDAPVMVEASRDVDAKVPHKKSHGILSGVGSKVKHSIAKVKKAITGKSSHPKPISPK